MPLSHRSTSFFRMTTCCLVRRHSGARHLARTRNPKQCTVLDSGSAPKKAHPGMTQNVHLRSRGDLDLTRDHAHDVAVMICLSQRAREHYLAALQNIDAVDVVGNMVDVGFGD